MLLPTTLAVALAVTLELGEELVWMYSRLKHPSSVLLHCRTSFLTQQHTGNPI